MSVPRELFLRHATGDAVGPLPLMSIEVLFDAKVVDEGTPLSEDGEQWRAVREWPEVLVRLLDVREQASSGKDPWSQPSGPATIDLPELRAGPFLGLLLRTAAAKQTGRISMIHSGGKIIVSLKDGKIAAVETTSAELSLTSYLRRHELVPEEGINKAKAQAPMVGGDLGAALISLGLIQPHVYFEHFVTWALEVLGAAATSAPGAAHFEPSEVQSPAVPLGFDRLGVMAEIVRKGLPKHHLIDHILPKRTCPVIISQVEGVKIEDCKPQARELRVLNAIDGVKNLGQILEVLGSGDENQLTTLRAVFFATECGFVVFGEDPLLAKEVAEAAELQKVFSKMEGQHFFEILGISEKSSNDEVRTKYTDLAKKYHTDTLRNEAHPELREIRGRIFGLVAEAFESVETEKKRLDFARELSEGRVGNSQDLQKAQDILQSETLFKKAEILVKVRKYDEALEHLERAITLNSNDTEFKVFRAYLHYLTGSKTGNKEELATEAVKKILGMMKTEPMIASGYLWLAHLNKVLNKPDASNKYYEKVLEFDEHHVEAQREIRTFQMRKDKEGKKKKWPF